MIKSIEDIQRLVLEGFSDWQSLGNVTVRNFDGILVFNYNDLAQYEARWNEFEIMSRGLLIDAKTGEIVARSFDKFFNWGERGLFTAAPIVSITEKMDGSLGILYRHEGKYRIATRGSLESEQAIWATNFLNTHFDLSDLENERTLLFEIIYPKNRVVVDYGSREDLVLLAVRNRFTGAYLEYPRVRAIAHRYGFSLPNSEYSQISTDDLIAKMENLSENEEGYVAEFADGQRFKFKSAAYLRLHKLISTISFKNVLAAHETGALNDYLGQIPDEFLGEVKQWIAYIETTMQSEMARLEWLFSQSPRLHSRKDFALWVTAKHKADSKYLFAMLDGKDIKPLIYKNYDWKAGENG